MHLFRSPKGRSGPASAHFISLLTILSLCAGLFLAFGSPTATMAGPSITISPAILPNGKINQTYNMGGNFSAFGGIAPYAFSVSAGVLPSGLILTYNAGNYSILGTPTVFGSFNFTIMATDNSCANNVSPSEGLPVNGNFVCGGVGTQNYTLIIEDNPPPPPGVPGYASNPAPGGTLVIGAKMGKPGSNTIQVSETGNASLIVSNPQITGNQAEDFSLLSPAFPFTIEDGGPSQSIVVKCNPSAEGKRKAVLTLSTNDPAQPTVSYYLVCGIEEEKLPADLIPQLRVMPDREAKNTPETEIRFTLTVKNVGPGEADAVRMLFPIDSNLVPGYTYFSGEGMWVSELVTEGDNPHVKVALPSIQPGQSLSAILIFRLKADAKTGAVVREQFSAGWDDQVHAGMTTFSNSVMVTLVNAKNDRDDTKGAVLWFPQHGAKVAQGQSIVITSDFYAPEEAVDFWYTDASGKSTDLGMFWSDNKGKLAVEFSTTGLQVGQTYTIVGKGRRSEIMGSAAITVVAPESGDGQQPTSPEPGINS